MVFPVSDWSGAKSVAEQSEAMKRQRKHEKRCLPLGRQPPELILKEVHFARGIEFAEQTRTGSKKK